MPGRLGLVRQPTAPRPKAKGTQHRHQNHANNRYFDRPANRELRNYNKYSQQDYAGDYEDGGESHDRPVGGKGYFTLDRQLSGSRRKS